MSSLMFLLRKRVSITLTEPVAQASRRPCQTLGWRAHRRLFTALTLLLFRSIAWPADFEDTRLCFDPRPLTLETGYRTEVGPFYYSEQKETQHTWAIPPFFSHLQDPGTDSEEKDFLYPVVTYDRYGEQY